jgi:hypothetical protein
MRVVAPVGRRKKDQAATAQTSFVFDGLHECAADALAAMHLVDDERADPPSRPFALERRRDLEVCEADDMPADISHEHTVADDREPLEARRHGTVVRWVPELVKEARDLRRILETCVPDGQIHGSRLRSRAR